MQKHDFPREPSREHLNSLKEHDRKSKLPSATETHIFDQICKSLFRNLYISRRVGHNISCQRLLMETFWDLVWSDDPFLEIVKTSSNRIAQISENLSGKECVPKITPQENMLSCWHVSYLCFKWNAKIPGLEFQISGICSREFYMSGISSGVSGPELTYRPDFFQIFNGESSNIAVCGIFAVLWDFRWVSKDNFFT